jgi:hypothetical protein
MMSRLVPCNTVETVTIVATTIIEGTTAKDSCEFTITYLSSEVLYMTRSQAGALCSTTTKPRTVIRTLWMSGPSSWTVGMVKPSICHAQCCENCVVPSAWQTLLAKVRFTLGRFYAQLGAGQLMLPDRGSDTVTRRRGIPQCFEVLNEQAPALYQQWLTRSDRMVDYRNQMLRHSCESHSVMLRIFFFDKGTLHRDRYRQSGWTV